MMGRGGTDGDGQQKGSDKEGEREGDDEGVAGQNEITTELEKGMAVPEGNEVPGEKGENERNGLGVSGSVRGKGPAEMKGNQGSLNMAIKKLSPKKSPKKTKKNLSNKRWKRMARTNSPGMVENEREDVGGRNILGKRRDEGVGGRKSRKSGLKRRKWKWSKMWLKVMRVRIR